MSRWIFEPADKCRGELHLGGDKSIAHRALLFGALAHGCSHLSNLPEGEDVDATVSALRLLGVEVNRQAGSAVVEGAGPALIGAPGSRWRQPAEPLQMGGSGTTTRLMLGILASLAAPVTVDGNASLRRRPMARVTDPLTHMGARFQGEGHLPLVVQGRAPLKALPRWQPEVASAQVKSAILLAGLHAEGTTRVREPAPSRDHTERMLPHYGVLVRQPDPRTVEIHGPAALEARDLDVPGDPSSAAFLFTAAALIPGGRVTVRGLSVNPGRVGFLDVLRRAGARVELTAEAVRCGEPVADVTVEHVGELRAVEVAGDEVPRLIDELPLVAILGSRARGRTQVRDAAELRVKESDRIVSVGTLLSALGARFEELPDGFIIEGPCRLDRQTSVETDDHRIAMAAAVAAVAGDGGCRVDVPSAAAAKSFPRFKEILERLIK